MRSVEEQLALVTAAAVAPRPVRVAISEAQGLLCAEEAVAERPLPSFDQAAIDGAATLVEAFDRARLEVLFDDRKASPGVKFKDAELIGVPTAVVVGRGLADGELELKDRATGEARPVPVDGAVAAVLTEVRDGR